MRRVGPHFILRCSWDFSSSMMPWLDLSFLHRTPNNSKGGGGFDRNFSGFFRVFSASQTSPMWDSQGICNMGAVYFFGAFLLLVALIYRTLNWHYRDRRRDRMTNQIIRDRYEHNRT
jgi:hypothetical protein